MRYTIGRTLAKSIEEYKFKQFVEDFVPPKTFREFLTDYIPRIAGRPRRFDIYPYWDEPIDKVDDPRTKRMLFCTGRQIGKTSFGVALGVYFTIKKYCQVAIVSDSMIRSSNLMESKIRSEIFAENMRVGMFLPRNLQANQNRVKLLNNSIIHNLIAVRNYIQCEGKSLTALICDELSLHEDLGTGLIKAMYTLSATNGNFYGLSIANEIGSSFHKLYKDTTQNEWVYDSESWYDQIQFDERGDITNTSEDLKKILKGRWVMTHPENLEVGGLSYHISQEHSVSIPRTIKQSLQQNRLIDHSLQYQKQHYPESVYLSHALGKFFTSKKYSITEEMVAKCFDKDLDFLTPEQTQEIKIKQGSSVRILGSLDFGSNLAGKGRTVLIIGLDWLRTKRLQLIHLEYFPPGNMLDEAVLISRRLSEYSVQFTCGDMGFGNVQSDLIKYGGSDSRNNHVKGLYQKYKPVVTSGVLTKEEQDVPREVDKIGVSKQHVTVNKTAMVDEGINFIQTTVPDPDDLENVSKFKTKLQIPYKYPEKVSFLVEEFTSVKRKDITDDTTKDMPSQFPRKEYYHVPDSFSSFLHLLISKNEFEKNIGSSMIYPIRRGPGAGAYGRRRRFIS